MTAADPAAAVVTTTAGCTDTFWQRLQVTKSVVDDANIFDHFQRVEACIDGASAADATFPSFSGWPLAPAVSILA